MFKPLPMQRITLKVMEEDAPLAALVLAESGMFNPEASHLPEEILPSHPAEPYQKLFRSAHIRLEKISHHVTLAALPQEIEKKVISLHELELINQSLGLIWAEFSHIEEKQHGLQEKRRKLDNLLQTLQVFSELDIDLSQLRGSKTFLDLHIGTLPLMDLPRFERAVSIEPYHFIKVFHRSQELAYVMVAGPPKTGGEPHKLLETADFHSLTIPEEFSAHPQEIKADLAAQSKQCSAEIKQLQARTQELGKQYQDELNQYAVALRNIEPYSGLSALLRGGFGGLALVEGWVPKRSIPRLRQALEVRLGKRYELSARNPLDSEFGIVPTVLDHSRFFKPFEALVNTFGIPRYEEFDPTILFGITFILMFGMMFGDIGHGAVILVAGLLFREKLGKFTSLVVSAGVSSTLFGFLYGSIFGYEHILHAVWITPLSDPMLMLTVALFWGIAFILTACGLKFYNLVTLGRYKQALFDNLGLAGVAFYLASLFGIYQLIQGNFSGFHGLLMIIPLASVLAFKWYEQRGVTFGERVITVLIEGFEAVMNFLSNTLSFMRVAAFSLNHAALAMAVFTIAQGMGLFGHWTTVVLGNLFILILEGAIVAIQVLRLEYYEGFARFFSGDGRAFRPLQVRR